MMRESVTIVVPIPHSSLHPNSRVHWRVKAEHTRRARCDARYATFGAWGGCNDLPGWNAAHVSLQAHYADRRRRDNDGLLASLKGAIDGIVDSGLLADDSGLTYEVLPAVVDRDGARVTITIRPVESEGE